MVSQRFPSAGRGRRARILAAFALALYGTLVAVSPVLHHDLACHVKSPGHCDACVANAVASRIEARTGLDAPALVPAGETPRHDERYQDRTPVAPTSGRSPPA